MANRSFFKLDVLDKTQNDPEEFYDELGEISGYGPNMFEEEISWYDYINDMIELSLSHPEIVFILEGEGEGTDCGWKTYFHNGKSQEGKGRVVYDEFDKSKLV